MLLPWRLWQERSWVFYVSLAAAEQRCAWAWEQGNPTMLVVVPKSKDKLEPGLLGACSFGSLIWLWPIGSLCPLGKNKPIEFDWFRPIWEECTGLNSANDRPLCELMNQCDWPIEVLGFTGGLDWWNTNARLFGDLTQSTVAQWGTISILFGKKCLCMNINLISFQCHN